MGLVVHQEKIDKETAKTLVSLCPFGAIEETNGVVSIHSGCRMCAMCVRKGPKGAITIEQDNAKKSDDKTLWRGVAVFAEHSGGALHNVTLELIGKARELAAVINHPVEAVIIGYGVEGMANELLCYGADAVYIYDHPEFLNFRIEPYAAALSDFISFAKPSSVLVGATNVGRSLAPRVAARFKTGLTADCIELEMKDNTDLVQIRPAFGGNSRPQFCTVHYKTFAAPVRGGKRGEVIKRPVSEEMVSTKTQILEINKKDKVSDISDAEIIVAAGRGLKSRNDIALAQQLADALGAELACTRPLVDSGWLAHRHQIGLSGRTVNAKLIIALGISGSVQFSAGMRGSNTIVAVNSDPAAPIFDFAHYSFVGDLYEIVPALIERIKEAR